MTRLTEEQIVERASKRAAKSYTPEQLWFLFWATLGVAAILALLTWECW